jgi:nucleotide-binding universal stress UspA family protein
MMYKVIMAPTEGSDSEKLAISVAVKLAQRFEAELRVVRVLTAPLVAQEVKSPPVLEITEQTLREERLARLRKLEALGVQLRALGDIRVITALEDGPVASTLRNYAEKFNVDLIVMASHARGGLKRFTLGSVTDYLIRHTNIPVLVVKPPTSMLGPTPEETAARIVVPLDGSPLAAQILPQVAAVALRLNATVTLLQVLMPQTYAQKQIMQPGLPWWDEDIAIAKEYLTGVASDLTDQGIPVSTDVILSEDVSAAILDYAGRTNADIIALATSGNGGMSRFVFGTVADEITRKSTTSLLVVHPKLEHVKQELPGQEAVRAVAGI